MDKTKAIRFTGLALLWLVTGLLGIGFVLIGSAKFSPPWPDMFAEWGFPPAFAYVIGVIEVAAGVFLLIPKTALPAATALGVVMVGATLTHLVHGERNWPFTLVLLGALTGIAVVRHRSWYKRSSPGAL